MKIEFNNLEIESLLDRLDGSGSDNEWGAVDILRTSLGSRLPSYLLCRFRVTKKWGSRSSLVYHAVRYAKDCDEAVELGLLAAQDKSKVVRYRGCMLLACSLRRDLVPKLLEIMSQFPADSSPDMLAALDAIEHQNQNYFVDRDHSGQITLNIA